MDRGGFSHRLESLVGLSSPRGGVGSLMQHDPPPSSCPLSCLPLVCFSAHPLPLAPSLSSLPLPSPSYNPSLQSFHEAVSHKHICFQSSRRSSPAPFPLSPFSSITPSFPP